MPSMCFPFKTWPHVTRHSSPSVKIHQVHLAVWGFSLLAPLAQGLKFSEGNKSCTLQISTTLLITCWRSKWLTVALVPVFLSLYLYLLSPFILGTRKISFVRNVVHHLLSKTRKGCMENFIWLPVISRIFRGDSKIEKHRHWMVSQEGIAIYRIKSILAPDGRL